MTRYATALMLGALLSACRPPAAPEEPRNPKVARGEFFNQIRKARGTRSPSLPTLSDTLLALVCR